MGGRILVLGGGLQGRIVAQDLKASLPWARVDVADVRPGVGSIEADLSDPMALVRLMSECDLAVGALPSRLGFQALQAAVEARRDMVDLSFCAEDPLTLESLAERALVRIVPDCGLAPGLSNLLVGRSIAGEGPADEVRIWVGAFAQDPALPYGYAVTWSVEDLLEEYRRPARILRDGRPVEVPALSGLERLHVEGVGELEAFYSDGLRTLLRLPARLMEEKTLRWPGHAEAVRPLIESGTFVETIRRDCTRTPPRDLVVLRVELRRGAGTRRYELVDRFDERTGTTALSRTTALTCSVVAQLLAGRGIKDRGVLPLERVARDPQAFGFIVEGLLDRGIQLRI